MLALFSKQTNGYRIRFSQRTIEEYDQYVSKGIFSVCHEAFHNSYLFHQYYYRIHKWIDENVVHGRHE
jgi:hypothetical protein